MKKSLLIGATVVTLGVGTLVPLAAHAQTGTSASGTSIVDKIASKFNLNKADVQKVFDEEHAARETEREQRAADKLAELVKAGTLTQAQADKITAKRAEMKANREANKESFKDMTEAERKAAMDAKKAELDQWAKDNGIDAKYLMPGGGGRGGFGHGPEAN